MFAEVSVGGESAHTWARVVITVMDREISEKTVLRS
jgi:hypothetical protein